MPTQIGIINTVDEVVVVYGVSNTFPRHASLAKVKDFLATPPSPYVFSRVGEAYTVYRNTDPRPDQMLNRVLLFHRGEMVAHYPLVGKPFQIDEPVTVEPITSATYDDVQTDLEAIGCEFISDLPAPDGKIAVAVPATGIRLVMVPHLVERLKQYGITITRRDRKYASERVEGQPEDTYLIFLPRPENE